MKKLIVLATLIAWISPPTASARPSIANLTPDETLKIRFQSRGCFNSDQADMTITSKEIRVDNMRTLPLTPELIEGLDLYFLALDLGVSGGCTTLQQIDVSLSGASTAKSEWHYLDDSCIDTASFFATVSKKSVAAMFGLPEGTDWSKIVALSSVYYRAKRTTESDN